MYIFHSVYHVNEQYFEQYWVCTKYMNKWIHATFTLKESNSPLNQKAMQLVHEVALYGCSARCNRAKSSKPDRPLNLITWRITLLDKKIQTFAYQWCRSKHFPLISWVLVINVSGLQPGSLTLAQIFFPLPVKYYLRFSCQWYCANCFCYNLWNLVCLSCNEIGPYHEWSSNNSMNLKLVAALTNYLGDELLISYYD